MLRDDRRMEEASIHSMEQRLETDAYLRAMRKRKGITTGEIKRNGSQPSVKGPSEYFTGTVRIDPLFEAPEPARVRGASVTFEPGARTAWHTHPLVRGIRAE
jgi:hypothetical protein